MNHPLRKKIRHQVLNGLTFFLVAVNLIPIAWMGYCGFKDNNEILSGSVLPGRRSSDVIYLERTSAGYLAGASDGSLTLFDAGNFSVLRHRPLGGYSVSFHREGNSLWALSSNKGLQEIDPVSLSILNTYSISVLAETYGSAWKTLWVNDVRGSSLTGSGGILYFSFDFKDYPGITSFSLRERTFRRMDGYTAKETGTVRYLASMRTAAERTPPRIDEGNPAGPETGTSEGSDRDYPAGPDSLAVISRQGVFFMSVPAGRMGKALWAGTGLPDAPDRLQALGGGLALVALGERACLFDFGIDSLRAWLALESAGLSRVSSLACSPGRLWVGTSQAALALQQEAVLAKDSLADAASARIFRPAMIRGADAAPELSGARISAILPLEDGRALLGGPKGAVSLLDADGRTLAAGAAPAASFNFQWRNYVDLWRNVDFGLYLKNSLIICLSVMFIAVIMAALGGYALARFRFPGKNLFGYSILATQMIPGIMLLLPVYLMFVNFTQATGIIVKGTYGGLILTYAAYFVPFSIWILRGFFASIPKELEEAALIDGCGPFRAFFTIIIPSAMPGIVATGVYVFLAAWDELMFAWVLTNESTYTIPVGIRLFVGNFQNRYDLMMAAATVSTLPVMIIFFLLQKQIVSGLTAGAVKD